MLDQGFWAEIQTDGEQLRLFSEHNAQGVQASVFDVKNKRSIAPSEPVGDIDEGKEKATEYAKAHLERLGIELPPLNWKMSRAV